MKNKVKISIIMGVYNPKNKKQFLRAVNSIIRQSFRSWELLLYDDGSDEPYAKLIRDTAALDDRIVYIRSNRNRGLACALNACIRHSSGLYIARMDDDDISSPNRLRRQYDFLETHPRYQWVGSNAELMDQGGVWGFQKMPELPGKKDFLFNSPYIHPSVMFRREVLTNSGGYDISRKNLYCEDYELFMRLHHAGSRGFNIQDPLLRYWEDYDSHKKRTFSRRIREMRVRYHGFQSLGILNGATFYYVLKPILVGAVPAPVHHYIKKQIKRPR